MFDALPLIFDLLSFLGNKSPEKVEEYVRLINPKSM
jgi:hypothetical protein